MALSGPGGIPINAEQADNFEDIEKQFAVKVVEHMSTYWAILEKMPGSKLRLTKFDDDILAHFKREFPDFDLKATINEDDMKSKHGKERWRNFIKEYETKVEDFSFGAMLRANPSFEYGEKETIFAVRMQFYAVEIARSERLDIREGAKEQIIVREATDMSDDTNRATKALATQVIVSQRLQLGKLNVHLTCKAREADSNGCVSNAVPKAAQNWPRVPLMTSRYMVMVGGHIGATTSLHFKIGQVSSGVEIGKQ
ncbi:hypothetical protein LTR08_004451 [Meristemomyces frigidus]|nr:hypothetical protein LTR08_004451 [Meristemomyces frigidus]